MPAGTTESVQTGSAAGLLLFRAIAENEELGGPLGCFWKIFWKRKW